MNIVWLPCYRNLWSHIHVQVLTQNCRFIFTEYWVLWTIFLQSFDRHWFYCSLIHFQFPLAIINSDVPFSIYGTIKSVSTDYLELVNIENWSGSYTSYDTGTWNDVGSLYSGKSKRWVCGISIFRVRTVKDSSRSNSEWSTFARLRDRKSVV